MLLTFQRNLFHSRGSHIGYITSNENFDQGFEKANAEQ